jgi:hypothetical protein
MVIIRHTLHLRGDSMDTWGDQNDLTVADELVTLDLIKDVADAALKCRNLTREQVVQLDAFVGQIAAGNPLACTLLDVVGAALEGARRAEAALADNPSTWRR